MNLYNFSDWTSSLRTIEQCVNEGIANYKYVDLLDSQSLVEYFTNNGWQLIEQNGAFVWSKTTTPLAEIAATTELATTELATEIATNPVARVPITTTVTAIGAGATGEAVASVGSTALADVASFSAGFSLTLAGSVVAILAVYMGYKLAKEAYEENPEYWDNLVRNIFGDFGEDFPDDQLIVDSDGNINLPKNVVDKVYDYFANVESSSTTTTSYTDSLGRALNVGMTLVNTAMAIYDLTHYGIPSDGVYSKMVSLSVDGNGLIQVLGDLSNGYPNEYNYSVWVKEGETATLTKRVVEYDVNGNVISDTTTTETISSKTNPSSTDNIYATRTEGGVTTTEIYHPGVDSLGRSLRRVRWDGTPEGVGSTAWMYQNPQMTNVVNPGYNASVYYNNQYDPMLVDVTTTQGLPDGLTKIPGATYPDEQIPVAIRFPDWIDRKWSRNVTDDGINTQDPEDYIPILPINDDFIDSITDADIDDLHRDNFTDSEKDPITDPDIYEELSDQNQEQTDDATDNGNNPNNPTPTDGGETPSPTAILPVVPSTETGMVAIYHPTKAEVVGLSRWLWSANFFDNIIKLFQDPMQAIISLHTLYVTPTDANNGTKTDIVVGYLDSGVDSCYVEEPIITLDCGSLYIPEYYGNAIDYDPYTEYEIFLPFIGFRRLSATDIVKSTINVTYNIDIITGTCVALITVTKSGFSSILYTFEGNCSVQIPVSGSNFNSIISGALMVGASVITGGAATPLAVTNAALSHHSVGVERSGSLMGNGGMLSPKKPYILCRRPVSEMAYKYNEIIGYPTNTTVTLGKCSGYTRVKECHLDTIDANETEKSVAYQLLKEGVIV